MRNQKGIVLILTFIIMAALTVIAVSFLYMTSVQLKSGGYDLASQKALWLAEAGLQKAIWNLKTPAGSGGKGENWTTSGTTESLGGGSYTMVVSRYDFALSSSGSTAAASSSSAGHTASMAIDNDDTTYWESTGQPSAGNPEEIIISFFYPLTINKVRFFVPNGTQHTPRNYTWQVSSDGVSYITVVTVNSNTDRDVTDTFSAASSVNYLKLKVTSVGIIVPPGGIPGAPRVRIATLEAIGAKITSTGTVDILNRKVQQTAVADDATQTASDEIDWNEIVPAV